MTGIGGIESLVAAYTLPSLAAVLTLSYLEILVLCVVLWGLLGYLIYLFTGRNFTLVLSGVYAALYVVLLYYVTASAPSAVTVTHGSVGLVTASTLSTPYLVLLGLGLLGPEIVGSILYFTLAFRTKDATVRYRVTLVSWSLIAWFGIGTLPIATLLGGGPAAQIFGRSVGVIAALVILLAYYPPRWIRDRLGVTAIDSASPATT
ncbi:MAG TPA: hypothetical protein VFF67_08710 [Thermoplasmata archaeon]|nr:hypothetical protein [Thermoplasmata archaeon]